MALGTTSLGTAVARGFILGAIGAGLVLVGAGVLFKAPTACESVDPDCPAFVTSMIQLRQLELVGGGALIAAGALGSLLVALEAKRRRELPPSFELTPAEALDALVARFRKGQ